MRHGSHRQISGGENGEQEIHKTRWKIHTSIQDYPLLRA